MNYSRDEASSGRARRLTRTTSRPANGPSADERAAEAVVRVVPRAMRQIRSVARAQAGGLSVPQFRALGYIQRHPGVGLTELAEHLGVSLPAASAFVSRLVNAGLVDRSLDPEERRRIRITVTESGRHRVLASQVAVRAWWRGRLAGLNAPELDRLTGALEALETMIGPVEAIEPIAPPRPARASGTRA